MIALLRGASFLVNVVVFAVPPLAAGMGSIGAAFFLVGCFALCWWACGLHPDGGPARPETVAAARDAARLLEAGEPRRVLECDGWVAAAVRDGSGYALLVGREVSPRHRTAVLAHEIAHVENGDLFWEPFTDGPGRLLLAAAARVPPLVVAAVPFLLLGAPLARATELAADETAARAVPSYHAVLKEVTKMLGARKSLLYPSVRARARVSARDSLNL